MALGIHSFYVFPRIHNHIRNRVDYFIGSFIGDHFNDEAFGQRLQKVHEKLTTTLGYGYTCFWSPCQTNPYKPLSEPQRYRRAITRATNIHKKKALQILQDNTLFTDDFLCEEINRHHDRVEVLKKRYHQPTESDE